MDLLNETQEKFRRTDRSIQKQYNDLSKEIQTVRKALEQVPLDVD